MDDVLLLVQWVACKAHHQFADEQRERSIAVMQQLVADAGGEARRGPQSSAQPQEILPIPAFDGDRGRERGDGGEVGQARDDGQLCERIGSCFGPFRRLVADISEKRAQQRRDEDQADERERR